MIFGMFLHIKGSIHVIICVWAFITISGLNFFIALRVLRIFLITFNPFCIIPSLCCDFPLKQNTFILSDILYAETVEPFIVQIPIS